MKKTTKGVTYETETAKSFFSDGLIGENLTLYQTSTGEFFLFSIRPLIDGKRIPKGKATHEILPDLLADPGTERCQVARKRVTWQDKIRPLTRRKALAWCIRTQMPRTFHKELTRFLK